MSFQSEFNKLLDWIDTAPPKAEVEQRLNRVIDGLKLSKPESDGLKKFVLARLDASGIEESVKEFVHLDKDNTCRECGKDFGRGATHCDRCTLDEAVITEDLTYPKSVVLQKDAKGLYFVVFKHRYYWDRTTPHGKTEAPNLWHAGDKVVRLLGPRASWGGPPSRIVASPADGTREPSSFFVGKRDLGEGVDPLIEAAAEHLTEAASFSTVLYDVLPKVRGLHPGEQLQVAAAIVSHTKRVLRSESGNDVMVSTLESLERKLDNLANQII